MLTNPDSSRRLENTLTGLVAIGGLVVLGVFGYSVSDSNRCEEQRKQAIQRKTDALYDKVFFPYALADTNKDGVVSTEERIEAFRRMGLDPQITSTKPDVIEFPQPTLIELQRAVNSYQGK